MLKIVSCENLTLGYDRHPAVHHLNLDFEFGSLTAVVGPNGGGKSTLLKGIAGTLNPLEGNLSKKHICHNKVILTLVFLLLFLILYLWVFGMILVHFLEFLVL